MAAEQKARTTYKHLINFMDDPGVIDALKFLREREVVHSNALVKLSIMLEIIWIVRSTINNYKNALVFWASAF